MGLGTETADPTDPQVSPARSKKDVDRQILTLAAPAFAALIAEPLMVMVDSAMVGHLGTDQLAGLALGSTLLNTIVYLFVFLTYTTTASASRALGAGDTKGAIRGGIDGLWFAGLLGIILAPLTWLMAPTLVSWFGASGMVAQSAVDYLRACAPGLLAMFLVLAATGALRGLLDTKTPMWVSVFGALFNVVANATLIWGLHFEIKGSGWGTSLAQSLMAITLIVIVLRGAKRFGVSVRPSLAGVRSVGLAGAPLLVRTVNLRIAFLLLIWAATALGAQVLAAHQITQTLWGLGAYALDALAIASQALIGHGMGTGEAKRVALVLRRCLYWGVGIGFVLAAIFGLGAWWFPLAFGATPTVRVLAFGALLVAALAQPVASIAFILDGVLIGAGKAAYLAWASLVNLLVFAPLAGIVGYWGPGWSELWGTVALWIAFAFGFLGARTVTNLYGAKPLLQA
ncbi:hypothetical protein BSR29_00390 [Boudabousia liubingyangii]|uniref:MATE family efflux transporter n=1 Tax=Boudabousia liubingyangii TaxID=1921764 RepID=A0A1Q5PQD6_9ACTO|nr:hypothetical protein BSR29_00390 [Boudabousia liubingyangii]